MDVERIAMMLFVIGTVLAVAAAILMTMYKRPEWTLTDPWVSPLALLRDPQKYIREPFARVVQILWITGLAFGGAVILILLGRALVS